MRIPRSEAGIFVTSAILSSLSLISLCTAEDVARVSVALSYSVKADAPGKQGAAPAPAASAPKKQITDVSIIQSGEKLSTGREESKSLILGTAGTARVGPDSEIQVPNVNTQGQSLEILKGKLFLNISADELKKRKAGEFRLKTPTAILAVKGTKFFVTSQDGTDVIGTHEGTVLVTELKSKSAVTLTARQATTISGGKIDQPRSLSDDELRYDSEYAIASVVRTPLALILEDRHHATGANFATALYDGKVRTVAGQTLADLKARTPYVFVSHIYSSLEKVILTADRGLSFSSVVGPGFNNIMDFKLGVHDANRIAAIGTPFAVQFRVRLGSGINAVMAGRTTLRRPTLSIGSEGTECIMSAEDLALDGKSKFKILGGFLDGNSRGLHENRTIHVTDFALLSLGN